MRPMPFFLFLLIAVCVSSCTEKKKAVKQDAFMLNANEEWVLQNPNCDSLFVIDSNSTVVQFKNYKTYIREQGKKGCIQTEIWLNESKHIASIAIPAQTISLGGANRNSKKKMLISVTTQGDITTYDWGVVAADEESVNQPDKIVQTFFKNAYQIEDNEDKNHVAFWPTGIILKFSTENIGSTSKVIPLLLQGYIYFLREKSLYLYRKNLDDLSSDEQKQLSERYPLYIDIVND